MFTSQARLKQPEIQKYISTATSSSHFEMYMHNHSNTQIDNITTEHFYTNQPTHQRLKWEKYQLQSQA